MTHTNCPVCLSPDICRSKRRSREWMLLLPRPYRCNSCNRRFLVGIPQGRPIFIDLSCGRTAGRDAEMTHESSLPFTPDVHNGASFPA
jgi:hypothetical protein